MSSAPCTHPHNRQNGMIINYQINSQISPISSEQSHQSIPIISQLPHQSSQMPLSPRTAFQNNRQMFPMISQPPPNFFQHSQFPLIQNQTNLKVSLK
ncbi:hypothetical protein M9Y10_012702 [Tritrichomonas musculus]|uniref:Uncharacterized protein n=1 Tax=Tritrichomonas musculus TaxID=1915356 RepID=A0ABR2ID60_9EUKA